MTSYRGGLTAPERRRIERQLYDGTLRAVTATSTLELGVDIALLEAVIILGFPGSVAKLWQRAGQLLAEMHMQRCQADLSTYSAAIGVDRRATSGSACWSRLRGSLCCDARQS